MTSLTFLRLGAVCGRSLTTSKLYASSGQLTSTLLLTSNDKFKYMHYCSFLSGNLYHSTKIFPACSQTCGFRVFQRNPQQFSFMDYCRHVNTSILSKLTEDIDLDKLRKEARREMEETGKNIQILDKVKETLTKRCKERMLNLDETEKKKLQVIQLEHNFMFSEGYAIPSSNEMNDENWLEALALNSKNQRLKYYVFIKKRMHIKESSKRKKMEKKESAETREKKEFYEHGRITMRIYESTMTRWLNYRLAASMIHGLPLVIDMDYVDFMRSREQKNTAAQLLDVYCVNRADIQEPFHLYFTGCADDNPMNRYLQLCLQDSAHFLSTVTPKSYLDLFDKEKIVYLSPHSSKVMREFDPTSIYVIGAFNDKATQKPISYARAKEQNLNCQRLPLDENLNWVQGNKALTLDVMMKIMGTLKNGKSWQEAFKVIPKRKLKFDTHSS